MIGIGQVVAVVVSFSALVIVAYGVGLKWGRERATGFGVVAGAVAEMLQGFMVVRDLSPLAVVLIVLGGLVLGGLIGGLAGLLGGTLAHRQKS